MDLEFVKGIVTLEPDEVVRTSLPAEFPFADIPQHVEQLGHQVRELREKALETYFLETTEAKLAASGLIMEAVTLLHMRSRLTCGAQKYEECQSLASLPDDAFEKFLTGPAEN